MFLDTTPFITKDSLHGISALFLIVGSIILGYQAWRKDP
jgi:cytochrome bd-type quinol oxidase subunit 1